MYKICNETPKGRARQHNFSPLPRNSRTRGYVYHKHDPGPEPGHSGADSPAANTTIRRVPSYHTRAPPAAACGL